MKVCNEKVRQCAQISHLNRYEALCFLNVLTLVVMRKGKDF